MSVRKQFLMEVTAVFKRIYFWIDERFDIHDYVKKDIRELEAASKPNAAPRHTPLIRQS